MSKPCKYPICDVTKTPNLRLITNLTQDPPLVDGEINYDSYFWKTYQVRPNPIRLTQDYTTTDNYAIKYGWKAGEVVNLVRLQCLVENIAPFGCENDWVFNESAGYLVGANYFFDNLFQFETYEKGAGNSWKYLWTDFKKEFFPDSIPTQEYILNTDFCYYYGIGERAIQAQMGDFYYNPFRFPNHDGIYKLIVKFNPLVKNCRAILETDYTDNEEIGIIEIKEGKVIIL